MPSPYMPATYTMQSFRIIVFCFGWQTYPDCIALHVIHIP